MKLNNRGFAISSIMYMILVMAIVLIFISLAILSNRKLVLDKIKKQTQDEISNVREKTNIFNKSLFLNNMKNDSYSGGTVTNNEDGSITISKSSGKYYLETPFVALANIDMHTGSNYALTYNKTTSYTANPTVTTILLYDKDKTLLGERSSYGNMLNFPVPASAVYIAFRFARTAPTTDAVTAIYDEIKLTELDSNFYGSGPNLFNTSTIFSSFVYGGTCTSNANGVYTCSRTNGCYYVETPNYTVSQFGFTVGNDYVYSLNKYASSLSFSAPAAVTILFWESNGNYIREYSTSDYVMGFNVPKGAYYVSFRFARTNPSTVAFTINYKDFSIKAGTYMY